MSQKQIGTVFGLLFAIQIAFVLLLSPINLPAGSALTGKLFFLIVMGALLAQPALIAIWAGLSPQCFVRRWTQALAMLMCFDLAISFASAKNASARDNPGEVLQIVAWLVTVAACQLPLWFLRRRFGWQIEAPVEPAHPPDAQINQFSISHLLAGMAVVAAFLAALRWLHPESVSAEWAMHLLRFAAMGAAIGLLGLLPVAICWLILLPGSGGFWRWSIGAAVVCVGAAAATAVAAFGSRGEVGELVFALLGAVIWSAASLFVVRLCGYRLVRRGARGRVVERDTIPAAQPIASTPRRFALSVLLLALVLMALATLAPARLQLWREKEEARRWSESGLLILQKDGEITTVLGDGGVWLASDTVDRINECSQLYHLDLSGTDADDETLVRLGNLPRLAGLELCGTRIGDRGVEQLGKFRALRKLNLCMTDVTDDCLVILAGLKSLESVELSHTCVTPVGIKWLQETNPKLRVNSIADDATLRRLAMGFRQRRTSLSQGAASPPPPLRFRAMGPLVTDAGVAALRGSTRIEELDLTDAKVTDAAVKDLATLTGAKKLMLSGTQITNSGAAELQRRLPDCKISR